VVHGWLASAFRAVGVAPADADLHADVLVAADLRGIRSHGVARLSYFLVRLANGAINPAPRFDYRPGTATTGLLLADNALGTVASSEAMNRAMLMAEAHGWGFVGVVASSHFGFAGFWAARAAQRGFIGIAMSNSGGRVAPTFSSEGLLGTNPLAVAFPGGEAGPSFLLDMATSAVAVGKVETALREGRPLPSGWLTASSTPSLDPDGVLSFAAPLLPLGGEGDGLGGHKGFGLALLVELLCGALWGSALQDRVEGAGGQARGAMGHFLGAIQLAGFGPPASIQETVDATLTTIRRAARQPGRDRIYIHGEPENEAAAINRQLGIPLTPALQEQLHRWNRQLDLGLDLP
jgi:LDH2 family malate/lactate/ureidoglycolate dehydrogenase